MLYPDVGLKRGFCRRIGFRREKDGRLGGRRRGIGRFGLRRRGCRGGGGGSGCRWGDDGPCRSGDAVGFGFVVGECDLLRYLADRQVKGVD